jgi:DNA-binding winged helix-turn-helix (wHTH) protein
MSTRQRSAGQRTAVFQFDDFTFDCTTRLLLRDGVERHLSPKAQQLLYLLLAARPGVLSREELYDALWPSTFVCETNLASLVNEVRRALNDDARASQYIRTVHGFGYAFCASVRTSAAVEAVVLGCAGRTYLLYDGENVIGRAPDARIVVVDPSISRHHAVITVKGSGFTVQDLDSKNGTYVDGQRIGGTPVAVTVRSRIHIGLIPLWLERRQFSSTASLRLDMTELKRQVAEILPTARRQTPSPN